MPNHKQLNLPPDLRELYEKELSNLTETFPVKTLEDFGMFGEALSNVTDRYSKLQIKPQCKSS